MVPVLLVSVLVASVGGGVWLAGAAGGGASAFVPITPCRLLDTRPGSDNVGTRSAPLGAGDVHMASVWGPNGNCAIPSGATGVSMNVVAIQPSASSFLTVYPADALRPLAASLNWVGGQAPTPNAVTSALSGDGSLAFYNLAGSVHLAVDIVGYYEPSAGGPAGPAGQVGAQGPKGDQGAAGPRPSRVVWVAPSGGDFTSVSAALDAIGTSLPAASAGAPYTVMIAPGTYAEPNGIQLENHVHLHGSGRDATILRSPGTAVQNATLRGTGAVNAEVRALTVENTGGVLNSAAIRLDGAGPVRLDGVTARATTSSGVGNVVGIVVVSGSPLLNDIVATADGGDTTSGVEVHGGQPVLTKVTANGSDAGGFNRGLRVTGGAPRFVAVDATGSGTDATGFGAEIAAGTPAFEDGSLRASGGYAAGILAAQPSTVTVARTRIRAETPDAGNQTAVVTWGPITLDGVHVSTNAGGVGVEIGEVGNLAVITRSTIDGPSSSVRLGSGVTGRISSSTLLGGNISGAGTFVCQFNVNELGGALSTGCVG